MGKNSKWIKKLAIFILLCLILSSIEFFSGKSSYAMGRRPKKTFPIHLIVDFGPAVKPGVDDPKFFVEKGTTPKEAVSQVFPVLSGKSCCSLRDLLEIGGVRIDPLKNRWWICTLNGSRKFSPKTKKLKRGDRLEWRYIQSTQ